MLTPRERITLIFRLKSGITPVSYTHLEYYSAVGGDKQDAFEDYAFYGGMPLILSRPTAVSYTHLAKKFFLLLTI